MTTAEEERAHERLREASAALRAALEDFDRVMDAYREQRLAGVPVADVYRRQCIRDVRDTLFERLSSYEAALTAVRVAGIRVMVEHEGLSFTEIGRLVRRSRQFVTRLYRGAPETRADR